MVQESGTPDSWRSLLLKVSEIRALLYLFTRFTCYSSRDTESEEILGILKELWNPDTSVLNRRRETTSFKSMISMYLVPRNTTRDYLTLLFVMSIIVSSVTKFTTTPTPIPFVPSDDGSYSTRIFCWSSNGQSVPPPSREVHLFFYIYVPCTLLTVEVFWTT